MTEVNDELIRIETISDSVLRFQLNSPDDRNALSGAMRSAILAGLAKARTMNTKVVIITGDERAFSSGYRLDPGVMRATSVIEDRRRLTEVANFMKEYRDQPIITIAEVRGYCLAGGTDLMLASDIALASDDAKLGMPNVRGLGITLLLPMWSWLLGPQRAKLLALTGDFVSGREAAQNGLVTSSYPDDELTSHAIELAERIAMVPRELLGIVKHALNTAWDSAGFSDVATRAVELDVLAHMSEPVIDFWDRIEAKGIKPALVERDSPFFTGRTPAQIAPVVTNL